MQGRKFSFATGQTSVNQLTHRQFMFTSEHKGTHLRHASGDTCLKEVYKFNIVGLQHNQNPQKKNSHNDTIKIKTYKWNKNPLSFECLKIQIIYITDILFKLYSIITEAGRDNV